MKEYATFVNVTDWNLSHIDGLVQERRNSIANALELRRSCTNPSTWSETIQKKTSPWGRLNIKMSSYQYRVSHVKDKTVSRPFYL